MQVTITAVGPDNRGLADPIVHFVTSHGANIFEIQMYDRDNEHVFAMLLRIDWPDSNGSIEKLRQAMDEIGKQTHLEIRVWAPEARAGLPRVAICTTYRPEPALAVLRAIRDNRLRAEPAVMIGNRPNCRGVAEQFDIDWHMIGDDKGAPDNERMVELFDEYDVDYVVLARYMRMIPASTCWRYAGGRIINLHHGLLPSFPGPRPYEDAFSHHMLTFGATVHFIVPELDAGNQIINQSSFSVFPGTPLEEIKRMGEEDNEPACLVEGLRRAVDRVVELHFHRVVRRG
jgi:formyltetrahydrofolate deformylase